jgi:hypothetical protein
MFGRGSRRRAAQMQETLRPRVSHQRMSGGHGTDPDVRAGMILTVIARLASGAIYAQPAE